MLAVFPGLLEVGVTAAQQSAWAVVDSVTIETEGYAPALSPNGRWVAGIDSLEERHICIWEVATGEKRCNGESERVADMSIAWSPDSRLVAYSQNGEDLDSDVFVLDVASDALSNLTDDGVSDLKAATTAGSTVIYDRWPAWSPDGSELMFSRVLEPRSENAQDRVAIGRIIVESGQVLRGPELRTDEPLDLVAEQIGVVTPLLWLPDGTVVLSIRGGRDIAGVYAFSTDAREPVPLETEPRIAARNVPLVIGTDAAGQRIACYWLWGAVTLGDLDTSYGWIDVETGEITAFAPDVPDGMTIVSPPRLSPDGGSIVYAVSGDTETSRGADVLVQDLNGGTAARIASGVSMQFWEGVRGIAWSESNQLVLPRDDGGFEVITLDRE
jgi:hypothetical protein